MYLKKVPLNLIPPPSPNIAPFDPSAKHQGDLKHLLSYHGKCGSDTWRYRLIIEVLNAYLSIPAISGLVSVPSPPGARITVAIWRCRKPLNRWRRSFQMKAALPLPDRLAPASCRGSFTGPDLFYRDEQTPMKFSVNEMRLKWCLPNCTHSCQTPMC